MTPWDRRVYAVIAGFFGGMVGFLGWFLYGLGHSMELFGAVEALQGGKGALQYTTSPRLHQLLGVVPV